jgi:hypothetical protein
VVAILLSTTKAETLSITLAPPSAAWFLVFGTPAPSATVSVAQLFTIVGAAADYWESIILDDRNLTIQLGFDSFPPNVFAASTANVSSLNVMAFNPGPPWFVDPSPQDHSEYVTLTTIFQDLGSGPVNMGIVYTDPTGAAVDRYDFLTVALHEVGHSLGLGTHLLASFDSLMAPGVAINRRKLPSDFDILAVAEAGQFTNVRLNEFAAVPEPGTFTLLLLGLVSAAVARGRGVVGRRRRGSVGRA